VNHAARKARIRKYKETSRPAGVYRVRNTVTGKLLIGSTPDLPAMLNRQRFQLEMGSHPDRELQRDWDELGSDAFEIDVLDRLESKEESACDPAEDLRVLKEMWLESVKLLGAWPPQTW